MTPHIGATKEDIAPIVIMPGDPLRAKYIAENFLTNYKLINEVRGMLGYTGFYKEKRITVMGHGMGMPSIGIYSYELYKFYDVDTIIRVGSCCSLKPDLKLLDIVLNSEAYTESNYAYVFSETITNIALPNKDLTDKIEITAKHNNISYQKGPVLTGDVFDHYVNFENMHNRITKVKDVIASEMESFALFHIANQLNKKAACLLTVVDSIFDKRVLTSLQREKSLNEMIVLALETAVKL